METLETEPSGGGGGGIGLDELADALHNIASLGAVLEEAVGASLLDLLGDGGEEGGERDAPDGGVLVEGGPGVGPVGVGAVGGRLLHLYEVAEAEVAGGDEHGAGGGVDEGGLEAEADVGGGGGDAAEQPGGAGGVDGEGAEGEEAAG